MNKIIKVMLISFLINFFLSIFKVITGLFSNSKALIADGVHSFSDLSTDIMAILGSMLSRKPADSKHPFGHGKFEYLTSILIGIVIICLGLLLITNSFHKTKEVTSTIVIIVSIFTISLKSATHHRWNSCLLYICTHPLLPGAHCRLLRCLAHR